MTHLHRPISILTQFNRIFEKLLRDRLFNFLEKKIYKRQFGFLPKRSTEQPVLDLKEHILEKEKAGEIEKHLLDRYPSVFDGTLSKVHSFPQLYNYGVDTKKGSKAFDTKKDSKAFALQYGNETYIVHYLCSWHD